MFPLLPRDPTEEFRLRPIELDSEDNGETKFSLGPFLDGRGTVIKIGDIVRQWTSAATMYRVTGFDEIERPYRTSRITAELFADYIPASQCHDPFRYKDLIETSTIYVMTSEDFDWWIAHYEVLRDDGAFVEFRDHLIKTIARIRSAQVLKTQSTFHT